MPHLLSSRERALRQEAIERMTKEADYALGPSRKRSVVMRSGFVEALHDSGGDISQILRLLREGDLLARELALSTLDLAPQYAEPALSDIRAILPELEGRALAYAKTILRIT